MGTHGNIKVAIADDHEIFRDGLRMMLQKKSEFEVTGEAADGKELIEQVKKTLPDIVISDVKMPRMDGVATTRYLAEHFPSIGIIALSMFDEEELIIDMLEAGARGYLLKNADKHEIVDAIKAVFDKQPYYCRHTSHKLAQMVAKSKFNPYKQKSKPDFNDRELKIIKHICNGLTSKQIADEIFLSVRTIEGLRLKIMEKMIVKNTAGIIIYAIKNHLFTPDEI